MYKDSKRYERLRETEEDTLSVPYAEFNDKYNERDIAALFVPIHGKSIRRT